MKIKKILFPFLFCFWCSGIFAQSINPVSPDLQQIDARTEKIKVIINSTDNPVEYPLQEYYHKPVLAVNFPLIRIADTTPPSAPSGLVATTSGIASVYLQFNPSSDPESGISYYAFAIGTTPNSTNIRYWQSLGTATITQSFSLASLGIAEGSVCALRPRPCANRPQRSAPSRLPA